METLQFMTLDVFTKTAYEGNPLAIVKVPARLQSALTQTKKQAIAREFNFSETVFLHEKTAPEASEWKIDIFTTEQELPFAGHPTIGSACYVLGQLTEDGHAESHNPTETPQPTTIHGTLVTKSGAIAISSLPAGAASSMSSVQAAIAHNVHVHRRTLGDLVQAGRQVSAAQEAGIHAAELAAPIVSIVKGLSFLLVQLSSREELGRVRLGGGGGGDESLAELQACLDAEDGWDAGLVGRYYFCVPQEYGSKDSQMLDLQTRMIDRGLEDPATGSAASALASYLTLTRGRRGNFRIFQGLEMGRKSVIGVRTELTDDSKGISSVTLSGSAVLVMEGSVKVQL